jgi:secreted Zn-dependent insulinase-like peptidase
VRNCFDKHFKDMIEKVKNFTNEEFEEKRKSVLVDLSEKDKNMAEAFGRFCNEVNTSRFNWEKQEQEIAICKQVTKEEWIAHYVEVFAEGSAKRLDLVYHSKLH